MVSIGALRALFNAEMGWFEKKFVDKIVQGSLPSEAGKLFAVWNATGAASKLEVLRRVSRVEGESLTARLRRVAGALKGLSGTDS